MADNTNKHSQSRIVALSVFFASLTGYPSSGGFVTNSTTVTQALARTGVLSARASTSVVDSDNSAVDSAGDKVACNVVLTNTGTTTLSSITISSTALLSQFERCVACNLGRICAHH